MMGAAKHTAEQATKMARESFILVNHLNVRQHEHFKARGSDAAAWHSMRPSKHLMIQSISVMNHRLQPLHSTERDGLLEDF